MVASVRWLTLHNSVGRFRSAGAQDQGFVSASWPGAASPTWPPHVSSSCSCSWLALFLLSSFLSHLSLLLISCLCLSLMCLYLVLLVMQLMSMLDLVSLL